MHDFWSNIASSNDELKALYCENMEKFNQRYQKVYNETVEAFQEET